MKQLALLLLKFYKWMVSPFFERLFGQACRFTPTCSEYAMDAVEKYGVLKGSKISLVRFVSCNPLSRPRHWPVEEV